MDWQARYADKRTTPDEAILCIPRGQHIFIGSGAAEPVALVDAMARNVTHFSDNTVVHLMTLGPAPYVDPAHADYIRHNAFFIGKNVRTAVHEGRADYTPVFLSRIPDLIRARRLPVDVALIQVSPPDEYGYVNLGISVDICLAALKAARLVIAEVDSNVPVIPGAGFIHMDRIDQWVESDEPLIENLPMEPDEVSMEIGRNVASLIEDGSTIQTGIGQIPDATLRALKGKRDLGVWTEMFSDGVMDLMQAGVITGRYKTIHPGKVTSSFAIGSRKLYAYLHRHPEFTFHPSDFVNDPVRIAQQHKMVSINSALQVDLTGQVCADSIGTKFYSGIGGQVDFVRGASMSKGGKPIIALPSTARGGTLSRITATLTEGAGVVTSRGDVRYVVTEYGVADLLGKSIRERAVALIAIAHPDFRSNLLEAAKERHYVFVDQLEPAGKYPREHERTIHAKNGTTVQMRPIRATDEARLTELFYKVSDSTLYKRFMRVLSRVSHTERQYYLDVDYRSNMALVLETTARGKEPEFAGVAQYFLDPATRMADVAFMVRDDWQGQGLGTQLFEHLRSVAEQHEIKGFTADVLSSNRAMIHVFHRSGLEVQSTLDGEVYRLVMPFPGPAEAEPLDD